jgi:hypothetical protein
MFIITIITTIINQSINPFNQIKSNHIHSINQPINQSTNQPINQSNQINQIKSINQSNQSNKNQIKTKQN